MDWPSPMICYSSMFPDERSIGGYDFWEIGVAADGKRYTRFDFSGPLEMAPVNVN